MRLNESILRKTVSNAETVEQINAVIANIITVSRIPSSLLLLALSPSSSLFAVLYLLCGVTDMLDGFLARKLHTDSKTGELLDSVADAFFTVAYAVKILPLLCVPTWIWIWTALIAAEKILGILQRGKEKRRFYIAHSLANKLTGVLIFLLPLTVRLIDVKYGAVVVCAVATLAATEELFELKGK